MLLGLALTLVMAPACGGGDSSIAPAGLPRGFSKEFPIYGRARLTQVLDLPERDGRSGFAATWETDDPIETVTRFYREAVGRDPWVVLNYTGSANPQGQGAIITLGRRDDPTFQATLATSVSTFGQRVAGYKTLISLSYRRAASAATPGP